MADDFAAFQRKLGDMQRLLSGQELRGITTRVAGKSKGIATGAISPNTLSHYGRRAVTVKARYDVTSDHEATLKPTPAGLSALLERGSGTSWKAPKRRGSKRRTRGSVGTYTRTKVPARNAWTKAVHALEPEVPRLVHVEVQQVLRRTFGG